MGIPSDSTVKSLPAMLEPKEMQVRSLGCEDPLEEEMATHSGIPAWRMPWTEEPDGLQSVGSQRVKRLSIQAQGNSGQHISQVQEWG